MEYARVVARTPWMSTDDDDAHAWIEDDERDLELARVTLVAAGVMASVARAAVNWFAEHDSAAGALAWVREQVAGASLRRFAAERDDEVRRRNGSDPLIYSNVTCSTPPGEVCALSTCSGRGYRHG